MVKCSVCGQTYGVTHSCPGPPAPRSDLASNWPVPTGFAPVRYFRQAIAIARLNDDAIVSASLDKGSLSYGAAIWLIGQLLVFGHVVWILLSRNRTIYWPAFIAGSAFLILIDAIWLLAEYGVCHLLARWLFEASGTYSRLIRPLLLGSVVLWLLIIPFVGRLVAGIWTIAVMMVVFEDIDGIERVKAFALSLAVSVVFSALAIPFLKIG